MNVLIVSSSERARLWVRSALGPAWECDEAAEGLEALRKAREEGYDLVIADETTEPYGAFGLARELKILDYPPKVVVLLERKQDIWLAKWSGADRWLQQPVDPFVLGQIAKELITELEQEDTEAEPARAE